MESSRTERSRLELAFLMQEPIQAADHRRIFEFFKRFHGGSPALVYKDDQACFCRKREKK